MRRSLKNSPKKLNADSQRLVTFSEVIVEAASRLEQQAWTKNLDNIVRKSLKNHHQDTIDQALAHLFPSETGAYELLMETVEADSESCIIEHEDVTYDGLLLALPILAWSRFSIPSGAIAAEKLTTLHEKMHAYILAEGARLSIAPILFSIDQLPANHTEIFTLTQQMAQAALKEQVPHLERQPQETAPFYADTRYLIAAVVVPQHAPIFRWQASLNLGDKAEATKQWQLQAAPVIAALLPGCGAQLLLPGSYFAACRTADRQIRPISIMATVNYLTHTLGVSANQLKAIIGKFNDESLEAEIAEYRISFTLNKEVVYGIIWPLYGEETDEIPTTIAQPRHSTPNGNIEQQIVETPREEIIRLLKESSITEIKLLEENFPTEFCDDCGAPLFPDHKAELTHAEMPEDTNQGTNQLH